MLLLWNPTCCLIGDSSVFDSLSRDRFGVWQHLILQLQHFSTNHHKYSRLSTVSFGQLLSLIRQKIQKYVRLIVSRYYKFFPNGSILKMCELLGYKNEWSLLIAYWEEILLILGILCQRWGILLNRLKLHPESVRWLIAANCALHNYLRMENDTQYRPPGFFDSIDSQSDGSPGQWRLHTEQMKLWGSETTNAGCSTALAIEQWQMMAEFFTGPGAVDFQWPIMNARNSSARSRPQYQFYT